ncbi:MAG TPA: WD40 repeat domain-containing protein [Planctomycetaceae bacterium]|nr:WD40 repeat domain-containing protein [Planctomycetaceae bacterium]
MGQLREDLRDTAIAAMALADVRTVKQQPLATNCRYCFDHALERFAAIPVAGDRSLTVYSISDNSVTLRQPKPDFDFWHVELMFAKNDRFLMAFYFLRDGTEHLRVTDLQSGTVSISSTASSESPGLSCASHPNGRAIVFAENPHELVVLDLPGGEVVRRIPLTHKSGPMCFDASGNVLAVSDLVTDEIVLFNFYSGEVVDRLAAPADQSGTPFAIAWSSDNHLLAVSRNDGVILIWNVPTRQLVSGVRDRVRLVFAVCRNVKTSNRRILVTLGRVG